MSSEDVTDVEVSESTESVEEVEENIVEDSESFLAFRGDFESVLTELAENEELSHISKDFSRVFEAYHEAHKNERKYAAECEENRAELADNANKIAVAMKLQEADEATIEHLKQEVETCWKTVDAAHARERLALETIENLRDQIARLNAEIEIKNRQSSDHTEEFGTASKNKEVLARERERLIMEAVQMKEKLKQEAAVKEGLERKLSATDLRFAEMEQEKDIIIVEAGKVTKLKERLESELRHAQTEMDAKQDEIERVNRNVLDLNRDIAKLEGALRESKMKSERILRDNEGLKVRIEKGISEIEHQSKAIEKLITERMEKDKDFKAKEEEAKQLAGDVARIKKSFETSERKHERLLVQKAELEMENAQEKVLRSQMKTEIDAFRRQKEADTRTIDGLVREREVLTKHNTKVQVKLEEHVRNLKIQELLKKKLETELDIFSDQVQKQRQVMAGLEKDRDRYIKEAIDLTQQIKDTVEEVKLKQQSIFEYKKSLSECETKYRMQQNLFEQVRADRNNFSKCLLEAQDQISDLKQKIKVMNHQVEQLKEDITTKETQLIKEEFALQKADKEKEMLRVDLQKANQQVKECRRTIAAMQTEVDGLERMIKLADEDKERQKKDMEQMMNERDILGTQLVRRNDELSLLYEKIRILQTTLNQGDSAYGQRTEDIRLLKLEIKRLRQEKAMLCKNVTNTADLRQEILHLERDLTREALKCKALEEEVQNPLNIHRWRKLEGSDPNAYDLIQKIQILQKRLIAQTSEGLAREQQLAETEQLYLNMRQILARQPTPETAVRLNQTQQALKDRGVKMKCMASELSMFEAQVADYKLDMDRVKAELNDFKKKYYELKRRDQKNRMREAEANKGTMSPSQSCESKISFTGGGFSLNPGRRPSDEKKS